MTKVCNLGQGPRGQSLQWFKPATLPESEESVLGVTHSGDTPSSRSLITLADKRACHVRSQCFAGKCNCGACFSPNIRPTARGHTYWNPRHTSAIAQSVFQPAGLPQTFLSAIGLSSTGSTPGPQGLLGLLSVFWNSALLLDAGRNQVAGPVAWLTFWV